MVVGVAVLVLARTAAGDPEIPAEVSETPIHLVRGAQCRTLGGADLTLRADTTILQPGQWETLDAALRSAQTAETRLAAENRSLRASAEGSRWGSLWPVAVSFAVGVGMGAALAAYELR